MLQLDGRYGWKADSRRYGSIEWNWCCGKVVCPITVGPETTRQNMHKTAIHGSVSLATLIACSGAVAATPSNQPSLNKDERGPPGCAELARPPSWVRFIDLAEDEPVRRKLPVLNAQRYAFHYFGKRNPAALQCILSATDTSVRIKKADGKQVVGHAALARALSDALAAIAQRSHFNTCEAARDASRFTVGCHYQSKPNHVVTKDQAWLLESGGEQQASGLRVLSIYFEGTSDKITDISFER